MANHLKKHDEKSELAPKESLYEKMGVKKLKVWQIDIFIIILVILFFVVFALGALKGKGII